MSFLRIEGSNSSWARDIFAYSYNMLRKETTDLLLILYSLESLPQASVTKADFRQLFEWFSVYRELVLLVLWLDDEVIFSWIEMHEKVEGLDRE